MVKREGSSIEGGPPQDIEKEGGADEQETEPEQADQEEVQDQGVEKKEKKETGLFFDPEKWINMSQVETLELATGEEKEFDVQPGIEDTKTFERNNGIVAVVDEKENLFVAPVTTDRIEKLKQAGYEEGNDVGVPLSGPGVPAGWRAGKWEKLRNKANEKNRQETKEEHLQKYQEKAEERNIEEINKNDWVLVDGEMVDTQEREFQIPENTDGLNMPTNRLDQVGRYREDNGIIAIVDEKGQKLIAPQTEEKIWQLEDANYERGDVQVPISSGGELQSYKQGKFEEMLDEAHGTETFEEVDKTREERKKRRRENKEE